MAAARGRARRRRRRARRRQSLRQEVGEGLRYVRSQVWLWGTFLSATFTYLLFIGPTQVLLPYVVRNTLHQGASTYGEVLAAGGVGALIGAVLSGRRRHPRRPMLWIYGWWTLATLAVAGYGLATSAWGLAGAALVVNGAEAAGTVVWATLKQRRVREQHAGAGLEHRLGHLDGPVAAQLRPHGSRWPRLWAPAGPWSGWASWGRWSPPVSCSCRACAAGEAGRSLAARQELGRREPDS